jgi:hypothetical protein
MRWARNRHLVLRRVADGETRHERATPEQARQWLLDNGYEAVVAEVWDAHPVRPRSKGAGKVKVNMMIPAPLMESVERLAAERKAEKFDELRRLLALGVRAHEAGFGAGGDDE